MLGLSKIFKGFSTQTRRHSRLIGESRGLQNRYSHLSDAQLKESFKTYSELISLELKESQDLAKWIATFSESAFRIIGLRPFDEQILAGLNLANGAITEVATGEGKTLIATIPAALYASQGKRVHIATVNSYLAKRDYELTSPLYEFLGLKVALLDDKKTSEQKAVCYKANINLGTGYQFGFDYLRSELLKLNTHNTSLGANTASFLLGEKQEDPTHRFADIAIIDEVDSVLLDEGLMPLIITSSQKELHPHPGLFHLIRKLALEIQRFCSINPEKQSLELPEVALNSVLSQFPNNFVSLLQHPIAHYISNALRAELFLKKDQHYIVEAKSIQIIDQSTGRRFLERTWSHGLHQAVQAKENIPITKETSPEATISRQSYFNQYPKISGMTGTAIESAREFKENFKLPTIKIPLHKNSQQKVHPARIFKTWDNTLESVLTEVQEIQKKGRPLLIATRSLDTSEAVAQLLKKCKIPFKLLNAKEDSEEAAIIEQAGKKGSITIATNMAGRGTHIPLDDASIKLGGLHVLAIEFNESSRIDRQLIGRSARQGQPGSAQFFISSDNELIQRYNPKLVEKMKKARANDFGEIAFKWFDSIKKIQQNIEHAHRLSRLSLTERDRKVSSIKKRL